MRGVLNRLLSSSPLSIDGTSEEASTTSSSVDLERSADDESLNSVSDSDVELEPQSKPASST